MWNEMELDTQYFWMRHGLSYSESWDACQNHLLQISCLHIDHFWGLPAAAQLDIYVWYAFFIYKAIECQSVCLSVCLFHKSYWWHWLVCVLKVACLNIAFEVYITVTQNCLCVCNLSLTKTAELNSWKASFWLWVIFLVKNLWFYRILFPGNPKQSFRGKVCPFWEFQFFSFIYTSGCTITKLQWFLKVLSQNTFQRVCQMLLSSPEIAF